MKLFGNRLPVISVQDLFAYASRSAVRIRFELCPCKELGKLVARVVAVHDSRREEGLGLLIDDRSSDYFVAGWSDGALRGKLHRLLPSIKGRADIVLRRDGLLHLFKGDAVAAAEASPLSVRNP